MNQEVTPLQELTLVNNLEAWIERAIPIYINAFHAFMGVVKEKKKQADEVSVECNAFYEALQVTRELTRNEKLLGEILSVAMAPSIFSELEPFIISVRIRLDEINSRCIEVEGELCIAPEDLFSFIHLLVEVISEVGNELSAFITAAIEPFNNFIRDFDAGAAIDLVDGEYHVLLTQETEELSESLTKAKKEILKLTHFVSRSREKSEPEVYVVCSKNDLVEYVKQRWSDQITLTKHAQESLLESGFKDLKRFIDSFDILGTAFYSVYHTKNTRMKEAYEAAERKGIEFKPSMSDSSMGRHEVYNRKYKSRKADFNKHLCLGTSRRPEQCLRVHFDWDEEEQKIVVHHAGNHLPVGDD